MNSHERITTALGGRRPDRVPIMEFIIDRKVWRALAPDATDAAAAMDRLGFDAVGCGASFQHTETFPDGGYRDEWGVTYKPGAEEVAHPVTGPIESLADAEDYEPPDPDAPHRLGDLPSIVDRFKGKRAICFHHRAAFMWSVYLMGMENVMMAFVTDPELVNLVFDKVLKCNMGIVRNAIRAGAEVIVLGDDYASNDGPMFSPKIFRQFIKPRLNKMIEMIHDEGALVIKHSDGNLYPVLDDIMDCNPDGLNPIEPVAGMTLSETRRRVGDDVCLCGNIDCGQLLPHGSPEDVRESVRRAIAEDGPGGAFILTSSNSIHSSCKPRNVQAMLDACAEFGRYPMECGAEDADD